MKGLFLVFCFLLADVALCKHHDDHHRHAKHHHHKKHHHHMAMMTALKALKSCRGDGCLETHKETMRKCTAGLQTLFDDGIPAPIQKFLTCFEHLKSCTNDSCISDMISCVGFGAIGNNCAKRGHRMKNMGHRMKNIPVPIKRSVGEYIKCKCEKRTDCTRTYIDEVENMMRWGKLRRCQKGTLLCSLKDDTRNCLTKLTTCVGDEEPEIPESAPQRLASKIPQMADAKICYGKAKKCATGDVGCISLDSYLSCINEAGWVMNDDKHMFCYYGLKSCSEETPSECKDTYLGCLGKMAQ